MSETVSSEHSLRGKRVLVVGAGSGIGRASARLLASDGAELWLAGRNLDALEAVAGELESGAGAAGGSLACRVCDAMQPDQVRDAVAEAAGDEGLDAAEHATWTVLASMILNLDETLTRE